MEFSRLRSVCFLGAFLAAAVSAPAQSASSGATPSAAQVALEQQREQIRKQEEVFRVTPTVADADRLTQAGNYAKARPIYLAALDVITPAPATAQLYNRAVAGLRQCDDALIDQARKTGDLATVETLLTECLVYAPNDPDLKEKLAQVQDARRNPQSVTLFTNPAVTSDFKKQVDTVESLFAQAEQARRTGQYDLAESKLKNILSLDPYNSAAQKQLERLAKEKLQYAARATEENRTRRLAEIEQKWSNPVPPLSIESVVPAGGAPLTRSNQFEIAQKLKSFIIPSIDFADASLQNAADFLNDKSRQLDPDHTGINFIPQPQALAQAKPITLSLRNIPLGEALRYITQLAQVKYKVDTSAVFFVPLTTSTEVLVRRQFNITPGFFSATSASPTDTAATTTRRQTAVVADANKSGGSLDVKDQLTQRGVTFTAEGANAIYLASSGILQVVNTQDQMDLIEELVNAETGQTRMVNIEARFVEINQTDLNDLTFNWNVGPVNGSAKVPSFATTLRGSNGFSNNNLDSLLASSQVGVVGQLGTTPNQFLLSGIMDGKFYSATLSGLAQKKSTDLLSAPSLRVKSGERATINATRTFYYPTSYDAPQIITQNVSSTSITTVTFSPPGAIPAFPSAFDKQEIGVILNIQPTVGGDNRTIDLSLVPEITDFEGFINYGDPITVSPNISGQAPDVLVANQILQPVFNIRRITTKVFIRDGFTVVLGGLIREDLQTINDKVPFLGDLPFVGRLFQSKANKSVKRNLLIFVTGKIVRPDGELFNPKEVAAGSTEAGGVATAVR